MGAKTGANTPWVMSEPGWTQSVRVNLDCGTLVYDLEALCTFPTWALVVNEGACRTGAATGTAGAAKYDAEAMLTRAHKRKKRNIFELVACWVAGLLATTKGVLVLVLTTATKSYVAVS